MSRNIGKVGLQARSWQARDKDRQFAAVQSLEAHDHRVASVDQPNTTEARA